MGNAHSIMSQCMYTFFFQTPSHPIPRFSDRDLFMRYRGGGIGHLATRQCNKTLLADKHTLREDLQDSDEDSDKSAGEGEEGNPGESEEEDNGDDDDSNSNVDDDGVREEDDVYIAVATNDVNVITAAGFGDL